MTTRLFGSDDHSPTLLGLSYGLIVHLRSPPLLWAPLLGVLAVATGLVGLERRYAVTVTAAVVCVITGVAGSRALVDRPGAATRVTVAPSASVLVYGGSNSDSLEETLFWNPNIRRVVVLGGDPASDGFASTPARPTGRGLLDGGDGKELAGPFVVGPDTLALSRTAFLSHGGSLATFAGSPVAVAFGFYRQAGLIAPFGRIFASAGNGPTGFRLVLRLSSIHAPQTIGLKCESLPNERYVVGRAVRRVTIRVPRHGTRDCRFGLVSGGVEVVNSLHVIARASLAIAP